MSRVCEWLASVRAVGECVEWWARVSRHTASFKDKGGVSEGGSREKGRRKLWN